MLLPEQVLTLAELEPGLTQAGITIASEPARMSASEPAADHGGQPVAIRG